MIGKKGVLGIIGGAVLGVFLLGMFLALADYAFNPSSKSLQLSPDMGGLVLQSFSEVEDESGVISLHDDIDFPGGVSTPGVKGSCKCTAAKTAKFRVYCANKDDPEKPSNYMKEVYTINEEEEESGDISVSGEGTLTYEDATPETATQFDVEGKVKTVTPAPSCNPDAKVDECKPADTCENVADPAEFMTYYAEGVSRVTGRACGANLVPGSQTGGAAICEKQ